MDMIRARLTHMGLYVHDFERMIGFYSEVLGLVLADRGPGRAPGTEMAFMTADPACHHQVVLISGRPSTEGYNPINQISFTVGSLAELRAVRDRALARGATGTTPARMVERLRVEGACRLLSDTRQPLKRVASRCGFGSEETMRRSFLRVLRTAPRDWRERFPG